MGNNWSDPKLGSPALGEVEDISVVTARLDSIVNALNGVGGSINPSLGSNASMNGGLVATGTATLTGGSIDNIPIGGNTPRAGTFTSLSATSGSPSLDGVTIGANGITSKTLSGVDQNVDITAAHTTATVGHIVLGSPVDMSAQPMAQFGNTTDQTGGPLFGSLATMTWQSTVFDTASMTTGGSSQSILIPIPGIYQVIVHLEVKMDNSASDSWIESGLWDHTISGGADQLRANHQTVTTRPLSQPILSLDYTSVLQYTEVANHRLYVTLGAPGGATGLAIYKNSRFSVIKIA